MEGNKDIDITKARCEICKKKVEAEANIGQGSSYHKGKETDYVSNSIYTYWSCKGHGAVGAMLNGKYYSNPTELFNHIIVQFGLEYYKVDKETKKVNL